MGRAQQAKTKVCANCRCAKTIKGNKFEVWCFVWGLKYGRTDRCGQYKTHNK